MFTVMCYRSDYGAVFFPRDGAPIQRQETEGGVGNCVYPKAANRVGKPTAAVSVSGLASGSPSLSIKAAKGDHAPSIKSLSISLPQGLSFASDAAVGEETVSLSGASIAGAKLEQGALLVSFKHASAHSTLTLRGPLLLESASLRDEAASHTARAGRIVVTITDSSGRRTRLTVAAL